MSLAPLHGRNIVVVGGTTGLGLSAAAAFIAAGACVVVVGRNPESAETALAQLNPEQAAAHIGDASESATAPAAIALAVARF